MFLLSIQISDACEFVDSTLWKQNNRVSPSVSPATVYTSFNCVSNQIDVLSTGKKRDGGDLLARRAPPTNWASTSVDRRLRRHNNHLALTSPQKSMHLPNIMIFICTLYSEKNHPVFGPKIHFVPKSVCCVFRLFGKNQKSCLCKRNQAEMHKAADTSVLFFPRRC